MSDLLSLLELQDGLVWTAALLDRRDSPGVRTPQLQRPEAKCEYPWPLLCAVVEHEHRLRWGALRDLRGGRREGHCLRWARRDGTGMERRHRALLAESRPQEPGLLGLGVPSWVPPGLSWGRKERKRVFGSEEDHQGWIPSSAQAKGAILNMLSRSTVESEPGHGVRRDHPPTMFYPLGWDTRGAVTSRFPLALRRIL